MTDTDDRIPNRTTKVHPLIKRFRSIDSVYIEPLSEYLYRTPLAVELLTFYFDHAPKELCPDGLDVMFIGEGFAESFPEYFSEPMPVMTLRNQKGSLDNWNSDEMNALRDAFEERLNAAFPENEKIVGNRL